MNNVSDETPDATLRRCYDCGWMVAYVSWWCTNDEASEARSSNIPGIRNCPYWKPCRMRLTPKRLLAKIKGLLSRFLQK